MCESRFNRADLRMRCTVDGAMRVSRQAGLVLPADAFASWHGPKMGYAFVHTVIDDHSRVAYAETHDDETAITAAGVLHRAVEWFADCRRRAARR
jgi:hypothetical protein